MRVASYRSMCTNSVLITMTAPVSHSPRRSAALFGAFLLSGLVILTFLPSIFVNAFVPTKKASAISPLISTTNHYDAQSTSIAAADQFCPSYVRPAPVPVSILPPARRWNRVRRQLLADVIVISRVFVPVIPFAKIAQYFFINETGKSLERYWARILRPRLQSEVYTVTKDLPPYIESFIIDLLMNGRKSNSWTTEEDASLLEASLLAEVTGTWTGIEFHSLNRTKKAVINRFAKLRKHGKVSNIRPTRCSWTAEDTQLLVRAISLSRQKNLKRIPWQLIRTHLLPDRSIESLRSRWLLVKKGSAVDLESSMQDGSDDELATKVQSLLTALEMQSKPSYRSKIWSAEEDEILRASVVCFGRQWKNIAETCFNNQKTPAQCQQRWLRQLAPYELGEKALQ